MSVEIREAVDRLLKIAEVQETCNVSRSKAYTILEAMQKRGYPYMRIGASIRVRESDLAKYLKSCEVS